MLSGRLSILIFRNVFGLTRSFRKLLSFIEAYTLPVESTGEIGAELDFTIFNLYMSDDLLNQASPDSGIENRLLKLLSSCSILDSRYKNDGILTVVVASSESATFTTISEALVDKLWLIAVSILTAVWY